MTQIEKEELYPLIFKPMYKHSFWGGEKLRTVLKRTVPDESARIGESWDLADRPGAESIVANGILEGSSIRELLVFFGRELAGSSFSGERFPLTVKIIDAGKKLPLQVHPDTSAAVKIGNGAEPCSKMWYILASDKGDRIITGLKATTTRQQFTDYISSQDIENILQGFDSVPGDAYFISAGRIHCAGGGNLLLEIAAASDTVYRISDWGRTDENGEKRPLQLNEAMMSIDFMDRTVSRICGASNTTVHNRKYPLINRCPVFHTDDLKLTEEWRDSTEPGRSFHLLTAVNDEAEIDYGRGSVTLSAGGTVLIPACLGAYRILVKSGITTTILKTTLS